MNKSVGIICGVIGLVLALAVGIGVGYNLKDNNVVNNGNNNQGNVNEEIKNFELDFSLLSFDSLRGDSEVFKKKVNYVSDFDVNRLALLIHHSSNVNGGHDNSTLHPEYSKEYIHNIWVKAFGSDLEDKFEEYFKNNFYLEDSGKYTTSVGDTYAPLLEQEMMKIEYGVNEIYLYMNVYFYGSDGKLYSDVDLTKEYNHVKKSNYRYVFKQNGDSYYFYSIEKI